MYNIVEYFTIYDERETLLRANNSLEFLISKIWLNTQLLESWLWLSEKLCSKLLFRKITAKFLLAFRWTITHICRFCLVCHNTFNPGVNDATGILIILSPTRKERSSEARQRRARFQQHGAASCRQVFFFCKARR